MKILVISPLFYPLAGGSQQYMKDLFSTLVKKYPDFTVDILCYNTEKVSFYERYEGLNIYRVKGLSILPGQFALPNPLSLLSFLLNHHDYQVVVFNTRFFDSSWWGPVFTKMTGAKSILIDHCATHPKHTNLVIKLITDLAEKTLVKISLKNFDVIFSISQATQKFLSREFKAESALLYGGINTNLFKPADKKDQIVFIGRLVPTKNPQAIIELSKAFPKNRFILIGDGPLKKELQNSIKEQQIKNTTLLGNLSQKEVAQILNQSTILINPSSHHEGIPTVLKEAGASKVAVIATDNGGTREIIVNGRTGLLIPQNNQQKLIEAFQRLTKSKALQKRLATNLCKLTLKRFDWESSANKLYQKISNYK